MCLILFSTIQHPKYKLILAANRDEFFHRKTLYANPWADSEDIFGGRDVVSGGTWLGFNTNGRFIAITNYRNPKREKKDAKSRGILSNTFLTGKEDIMSFIEGISKNRNDYNGFNLLLSEDGFDTLTHYSNVTNEKTSIQPGIHGISNALLDSSWPKVDDGKKALLNLITKNNITPRKLIKLLKTNEMPPDHLLPNTGISFDIEKKLSPVFISMNGYGTRCSTILLVDHNNVVEFHEVTYGENSEVINKAEFKTQLKY